MLFTFVMKQKNLNFLEAVKYLADKGKYYL